ncbi:MAG: 2-oxoglutarate dehydrogenase complex dihydrolipoyllysine-residue succinyltransferase [Gammaproteobacteria bacterium]
MLEEIKVPALAESVADATLLEWQKSLGDFVKRGENLIDLETDKVTLEVAALNEGILKEILKNEGDLVVAGDILAIIDTDAEMPAQDSDQEAAQTSAPKSIQNSTIEILDENTSDLVSKTTPASGPAVRKLITEKGLDANEIEGSGKEGRITKSDVQTHLQNQVPVKETATTQVHASINETNSETKESHITERQERRVPMSRLRQRAAERLLSAQSESAILTTFNEINLLAVKQLRAKIQPEFEEKYGYRLGFMPFFVQAAINALKEFPLVNASIEDQDIVYHDFYDISVAVSSPRGLVVPVMRDADQMSFPEIEGKIRELGNKAKNSSLALDDLTGGTFTITNGGTFGSMLSTPIINPPQSAILGMHAIQDRPVAENNQVVIRPVMFVALSYDHRIIDGREAVSFLVSIKKQLEEPAMLFLEI